MNIESFFTIIEENNMIIMLMLTHVFAFFIGLSISDRKSVFASVLSWYMQFKVKLKTINSISATEYNDICEDMVMIALSLFSGSDGMSSCNLVLDSLRHNSYELFRNREDGQLTKEEREIYLKTRTEAISKIENLINESLSDLDKIRRRRTLSNLLSLRKLLKEDQHDYH